MGVVYVINHVLLELVVIWNVQHTVNVMTMENVHVISMELTQAIDVMNLVVQVGQLPVKDMVHVIL
jgi:hypothetical protein